jgi:hypothetical protein
MGLGSKIEIRALLVMFFRPPFPFPGAGGSFLFAPVARSFAPSRRAPAHFTSQQQEPFKDLGLKLTVSISGGCLVPPPPLH